MPTVPREPNRVPVARSTSGVVQTLRDMAYQQDRQSPNVEDRRNEFWHQLLSKEEFSQSGKLYPPDVGARTLPKRGPWEIPPETKLSKEAGETDIKAMEDIRRLLGSGGGS